MPYVYDEDGYVRDWGRSNIYHVSDDGYVAAWKMWQVTIWWKKPSHHWYENPFFHVERFGNIPRHYNNYFHRTVGRTDDIVFVVECCIWSQLYGWRIAESD